MGGFFLDAQTVRVSLSTISIIGSSLIDVMIIKNDGLRKSPYSRIIFGLSFGDIMLSLGLLLGPIFAPKGTKGAIWAIGNGSSCEAIGFVMNLGISGVPFYVAFLAFYFDQRVRHKLSRQAFTKKYEMKLHILIWMYPIIGGIVGICLDFFNPGVRGNLCIMTAQPLKCQKNVHDKSCQNLKPEKTATELFKYYQMLVPFLASFIIMVYCLARLTAYVYQQEKMFLPEDKKNISWKQKFENYFKSRKETQEKSNEQQDQEDNASSNSNQNFPGENIEAATDDNAIAKSKKDTTDEHIEAGINVKGGKIRAYSSQHSPLFEQSDHGSQSEHGGLDSIVTEMEDINLHQKIDGDEQISSIRQSSLSVETPALDSIVSEMEDDTGTDSNEHVTIRNDYDIENNKSIQEDKSSLRTSMTTTVSNSNESSSRRATPINDTNQLAKAALLQSFLYISAWLLTYSIPIVGIISSIFNISLSRPLPMLLWKSILWPLGGFFNVFIYSRPKVQKLRESSEENKNRLWIVLFAQVIKAGGEVHKVVRSVSPIITSEEKEIPVNSEEAKKYDSVDQKHISKSLLKGSLNEEADRKFYTADYRALDISSQSIGDSSVGISAWNNLKDIPEDSEC